MVLDNQYVIRYMNKYCLDTLTMQATQDLKMFGALFLALFVIGIIVAVTWIGFDKLKDAACETVDTTYDWDGANCNNASGSAVTVTTITNIGVVETGVTLALGLLSLVIVVAVFGVVIKIAKGMSF